MVFYREENFSMKQKTAYLGLFSAVAIILGYVESLIPVFAGIPGIKLGLANIPLKRLPWFPLSVSW